MCALFACISHSGLFAQTQFLEKNESGVGVGLGVLLTNERGQNVYEFELGSNPISHFDVGFAVQAPFDDEFVGAVSLAFHPVIANQGVAVSLSKNLFGKAYSAGLEGYVRIINRSSIVMGRIFGGFTSMTGSNSKVRFTGVALSFAFPVGKNNLIVLTPQFVRFGGSTSLNFAGISVGLIFGK
ncbi:MAG: hypothetical protein IIB00_04765 [candidate division Zixibacteria bacterium]|nr:hypothetical protein [candidate division Zixibacteria bacterium]